MEDVNMSSAELRELMLPSDLVVPEEVVLLCTTAFFLIAPLLLTCLLVLTIFS